MELKTIVVTDYDPEWPRIFERLRQRLWASVVDAAVSIEHVGSTSVPGLAAKPIVDIDIVVESVSDAASVIERLTRLGYTHRGNLGVEGREAFHNPAGSPSHHLYVCQQGSLALRNHLAVRDYLLANPDVALGYGQLKMGLAKQFPHDIDSYIDGKCEFILNILRDSGLSADELDQIAEPNRL